MTRFVDPSRVRRNYHVDHCCPCIDRWAPTAPLSLHPSMSVSLQIARWNIGFGIIQAWYILFSELDLESSWLDLLACMIRHVGTESCSPKHLCLVLCQGYYNDGVRTAQTKDARVRAASCTDHTPLIQPATCLPPRPGHTDAAAALQQHAWCVLVVSACVVVSVVGGVHLPLPICHCHCDRLLRTRRSACPPSSTPVPPPVRLYDSDHCLSLTTGHLSQLYAPTCSWELPPRSGLCRVMVSFKGQAACNLQGRLLHALDQGDCIVLERWIYVPLIYIFNSEWNYYY